MPIDVERQLKAFWNSDRAYYDCARAANVDFFDREHELHRRLVDSIAPGSQVLDLGCGTCEPSRYLEPPTKYYGVDVSQMGLRCARERDGDLRVVRADAAALPFGEASFDVVMSTYALEHFSQPQAALREAIRMLKPGGRLVLLSPAFDHPLSVPASIDFKHPGPRGVFGKLKAAGLRATLTYYLQRYGYLLRQVRKQVLLRCVAPYVAFETVPAPRVFFSRYQPDYDLVYVVSVREVVKFLQMHGVFIETVLKRERAWGPWSDLLTFFVPTLFIIARRTKDPE